MFRRRRSMVVRIAALFAALLVVQLAEPPRALYADAWEEDAYYDDDGEDGIGTRWRKCRLKATEDYWECRSYDMDSKLVAAVCYFLWDLDNIGCDIELLNALLK
jgi:hypothetical protein